MEFFDIVDEKGIPTGETIERHLCCFMKQSIFFVFKGLNVVSIIYR